MYNTPPEEANVLIYKPFLYCVYIYPHEICTFVVIKTRMYNQRSEKGREHLQSSWLL